MPPATPPPPLLRNQGQLADRLGVSRLTVHRALHGQPGVSDARRRQIIAAAADLGYRPNAAARATVTGRTNCVCMVSSTTGYRSTLFPGLIRGAHDALAAREMHLTLAHVDDAKLTDAQFVPKALREWLADGLLINYTQEIPPALIELLRRHQIPCIWVNSQQPADCVYFDDRGAARQLTEHLLALGHRRIAFVCYALRGPARQCHYSVTERRRGYEQAMAAAGLPARAIMQRFVHPMPDQAGESTVPMTLSWLAADDRPTAIVTYSHVEATAAWVAAQQQGLRVPADLGIATFADNVDEGMGLQVTRMWTNHYQMARVAVDHLLRKLTRPEEPIAPSPLPLTFWPGASCSPCAAP